MILRFSDAFGQNRNEADLCDIAVEAALNGHYIECSKSLGKRMRAAIKAHASTSQKSELAKDFQYFDAPTFLSERIRIYDVPDNLQKATLIDFLRSPSRLVIENSFHEWPVYRHLIDIYSQDREYGDFFRILKKAKDRKRIVGKHAGGKGDLIKALDCDPVRYAEKNIMLMKSCVLFDRDTTDDTHYAQTNNPLFQQFCGKNCDSISFHDIYTLTHEAPVWHMWYKRAIENYIPDRKYAEAGCDIAAIEPLDKKDRSYYSFSLLPRYKKAKLSDLIGGVAREEVDDLVDTLDVDGNKMTEMQLFLLKLVKIL